MRGPVGDETPSTSLKWQMPSAFGMLSTPAKMLVLNNAPARQIGDMGAHGALPTIGDVDAKVPTAGGMVHCQYIYFNAC